MVKNTASKLQITIYLILVFVISWSAVIGIAGIDGILNKTTPIALLGVAMLLGTGVSGLALTGIFDGAEGFKRLINELKKWKVAARWWFAAVLTVPSVIALSVLILAPFLENPIPAILQNENKAVFILSSLGAALFVALFEEIGWTGFLTPKLMKRMTGLKTGLFVGLIWGLWHLILFIEADTFTTFMGLILLVTRLFTTLPVVRIIMVIIYENTQSFIVTTMVHVSLVFSMMLFEPTLSNNEMIIYILIRTVILLLAAKSLIRISRSNDQGDVFL